MNKNKGYFSARKQEKYPFVTSNYGCIAMGKRTVVSGFPKSGLPFSSKETGEIQTFDFSAINDHNDEILVIYPYPGMVYPEIGESVKYILLNTYHSGTINTRSPLAKEFFAKANERGIKIYVVGVTEGLEYESARIFGELGITPLKNISPVAAYVKLWILSQSCDEVTDKFMLSLSGDIVPQ